MFGIDCRDGSLRYSSIFFRAHMCTCARFLPWHAVTATLRDVSQSICFYLRSDRFQCSRGVAFALSGTSVPLACVASSLCLILNQGLAGNVVIASSPFRMSLYTSQDILMMMGAKIWAPVQGPYATVPAYEADMHNSSWCAGTHRCTRGLFGPSDVHSYARPRCYAHQRHAHRASSHFTASHV